MKQSNKEKVLQMDNRQHRILLKNRIEIVYLDNHLLVALKPAGMLTQGSSETFACKAAKNTLQEGRQPGLQELLKAFLKAKYNKKGNVFLHPVHRLDRPVSGLVAFARTSKALSRLNEQMRNKQFVKSYQALVEGKVAPQEKCLENFISHGAHKAEIVSEKHKKAKKALLKFKVLQTRKQQTLLQVELYTGRYHQIRLQLAHMGHPIAGDGKYGPFKNSSSLKLHACRLVFFHPVTRARLSFTSSAGF